MSKAGVDPEHVKQCGRCGWQQSTGRGEFVLSCPDCGSCDWQPTSNAGGGA